MNYSYVITRLNAWSLDKARREDSGLGWPSKLPGYDGMPIGSGGQVYAPSINQDNYEIDQCVCALRKTNQMLHDIIILTYTKRNMTIEQILKQLGCCKQTYYTKLGIAHLAIQNLLTDLSIGVKI